MPLNVTGGIAATVIMSDVADGTPVVLTVKFAEPAPIPVIFTVHDGIIADKVQLLGDIKITELLLLVIATIVDSVVGGLVMLMVIVIDSPTTSVDLVDDEITNSSVLGVGVGVGDGELLLPAEQEISTPLINIIESKP